MERVRVSIVHNILTPYMVPVFNEIASRPTLDIVVYSMGESERNREWKVEGGVEFRHVILRGSHFAFGDRDTSTVHVNLSILQKLSRERPEVIVSSGYSSITNQLAFYSAKTAGIPFLLWSGSTQGEKHWLKPGLRPYLKWFVANVDGFIAYGSAARDYLICLGAPRAEISIAPNTVDTSFFKESVMRRNRVTIRQNLREQLGLNASVLVLYVGQLIERKGVDILIRAMSIVQQKRDVGLVVVGDGRERSSLTHLSRGLKEVVFTGNIKYRDLPDYYALADMLVLPSREEVWGLVVNEAMACGTPILCSSNAGCSRDLVKDSVNGFVFQPGDVNTLAQRIEELASDAELRGSFGSSSQQIIAGGFTIKHLADGVEQAITRVATKNPVKRNLAQ